MRLHTFKIHPIHSAILILVLTALYSPQKASALEGSWQSFMNTNQIRDFDANDTSIWCATQGGAVRWDKKTGEYTHFSIKDGLFSNYINSVFIDRKGRVWLSCPDNGVCCFDGGVIKRFTPKDGAPYSFRSAYESSDGSIWFGGEIASFHEDPFSLNSFDIYKGGGVYRYDNARWDSWFPEEYLNWKPNEIAAGLDGSIWFATDRGLWRLANNTWKRWLKSSGLPSNKVFSVAVSRSGTVWIVTDTGVYSYNGAKWRAYTSQDGLTLPISIRQILIDKKDTVWARSVDRGIFWYDGTSWKNIDTRNGLPSNRITRMDVDSRNVKWLCHESGVTSVNDSEFATYTSANSGLVGNRVTFTLHERNGSHWFVTDKGLSCFADSLWTNLSFQEAGLTVSTVTAVAAVGDTLWFGTAKGLVCFDGRSWKTFTTTSGLLSDNISALASDDSGQLWIGLPNTEMKFDGTRFMIYHEKDRLISKNIYDIAEDRNGVMWFATTEGLSRFDGSSWRTFMADDGLESNGIQIVEADPDGRILFGGNGTHLTRVGDAGWERLSIDGFEPQAYSFIPRTNEGWIARCTDDKLALYNVRSGTVSKQNNPPWPDGISYFMDKIYIEDSERFLLKTSEGLCRYAGGEKTLFQTEGPPSNATYIRDALVDYRNVKWFLAPQSIVRYDGTNWTAFKLPDSLLTYNMTRFAVDSMNCLWIPAIFSTGNPDVKVLGILNFDGEKWKKYTYDLNPSSDHTGYKGIKVGNDGVKWIFLQNEIISFDGVEWRWYSSGEIGSEFSIYDFAIDRDNLIWVSSSKGVFTFNRAQWVFFTNPPDSRFGNQNGLGFDPQGHLLLGGYRYIDSEWKNFLFWGAYLTYDWDSTGRLWANSEVGGVVTYMPDELTRRIYTMNDGLPDNSVYTLMVDRDDVVWVGTSQGIARFVPENSGTQVSETAPGTPTLYGNHPNPFNSTTAIQFSLYNLNRAELSIYSVTGQKIRKLISGVLSAGIHTAIWNGRDDRGRDVASGVYFARFETGGKTMTSKMLLMK
jgi:ligand-binding sensor domain-containing protein